MSSGDHQYERIERQTEDAAEPEPPNRRQGAGEHGDPYALPAAELEPEDRDHRRDRGDQHPLHLRKELHEVGVEDRKPRHVDLGVGVLLTMDDVLELLPHSGEVEVLLPESGDDQRRLVVGRDEEAVNAFGRVDLLPHEGEIFFVLRETGIGERHDFDSRARGQRGFQLRVRDRDHLLAIDSGDVVQEVERDAVDLLDGLRLGEDVSVLHLDGEKHDVRRAEHVTVLRVELDVRMARRIEIEKVRVNRHVVHHEVDEVGRRDADDPDHVPAVSQQEKEILLDVSARQHLGLSDSYRLSKRSFRLKGVRHITALRREAKPQACRGGSVWGLRRR